MFFLQASENTIGLSNVLIFGTIGMFVMAITLVSVVVFHQRRVIKFNKQLQKLEEEKQQMLLKASINFQEEERQRIAADLHDDAGRFWQLPGFTLMKILFTRNLPFNCSQSLVPSKLLMIASSLSEIFLIA